MNINRYDIHTADGKYLGYIDAPNQGAAEKIFRQKAKRIKAVVEGTEVFTRQNVVASYDGSYNDWEVEQKAGKFD